MKESTTLEPIVETPVGRNPWQPPAIVLERSLEVSAQGGPPNPGGAPGGFLGPLGTSGGAGGCT